jgi:hypothetical protein
VHHRRGCFAVDINGIAKPDPNIAAACSPVTGDDHDRADDGTDTKRDDGRGGD